MHLFVFAFTVCVLLMIEAAFWGDGETIVLMQVVDSEMGVNHSARVSDSTRVRFESKSKLSSICCVFIDYSFTWFVVFGFHRDWSSL